MEHVRADEGIERGPRKPPAKWPDRKPAISGKLGPDFNPEIILTRYLQGELLADIAVDLGVSETALNYHLLKPDIREAWREAQVAVSLTDYQEAKSVVKSSPDALSLARAREIARFSQFDLERLEPKLFGQKQELTLTHTVPGDVLKELAALRQELGLQRGNVIDVAPIPNAALLSPISEAVADSA